MDDQLANVFRGYIELGIQERKEFREMISEFEGADYSKKKEAREIFNKSLGPLMNDVCKCCGK
ncbi:hypothetical protein APR41_02200 [Salegentibacter salinarum]|uniref:Uncharacterized protein n=1 Tax=Salegentibacter salinarum TaxID=447422 RepID=A0A2N0U481_9FLAO|nr:hypothetical protein [Salegentibacter salinarum]PKD21813.1 hypothetical protein APR41_02200 [Salegentibacter salinarum]SKB33389.1 hypothetical protein SAMN05660903_00118 [Salegentibacter salinarum]